MNLVFFIHSKAASALRTWILDQTSPRRRVSFEPCASRLAVTRVAPTAPTAVHRTSPATRPLRVVRVIERGQSRTDVGRMVISGRMADVCAELDRLVAREAAESSRAAHSIAIAC